MLYFSQILGLNSMPWCYQHAPTVQTVQFRFRPLEEHYPLLLVESNLNITYSSLGFCHVCLDQTVTIHGSGYRVFVFIVTFRYPTANRKLFTFLPHCLVLMYCSPLWSKTRETHTMPHQENWSRQSVNHYWCSILGNRSWHLIPTIIHEVWAQWIAKEKAIHSLPIQKTSLNRWSMIFAFTSWLNWVPTFYRHSYMRFRLSLWVKWRAIRSLPISEHKSQQSINDFWSSMWGN